MGFELGLCFRTGDQNEKVNNRDKLLEKGNAVPFSVYSFQISKFKKMAKWNARAHSAGVPPSIITVIANPVGPVYILVLKVHHRCRA